MLIATLTAGGSTGTQTTLFSNSCFTNPGAAPYNYYEIQILGLQASANNAYLYAQFISNTNGNILNDSGYNVEGYSNDSGDNRSFTNNGTTFVIHDPARTGVNSSASVSATLTVYDPGNSYAYKNMDVRYYATEAFNNKGCIVLSSGAYLTNTSPITGISFAFSNSITITNGTIKIYGFYDTNEA